MQMCNGTISNLAYWFGWTIENVLMMDFFLYLQMIIVICKHRG